VPRRRADRFRLEAPPARDGRSRLRCPSPVAPPLVVLVEPEIPPNTGNVARLCAAAGVPLHLVEPIGFDIGDRAVRRAGLDYWSAVDLHVHASFDAFLTALPDPPPLLFSARAERSYLDAPWTAGVPLVFGRESMGLPDAILDRFPDRVVGIPTAGPVRSLNLASAAAVALYEALRALGRLRPSGPGP
jgi:tRNA (cytidine/uridine-2'-O-)-methyltransferase